MEEYIVTDEDSLLSPVVVVATVALIGLFGLGLLYQFVATLVF